MSPTKIVDLDVVLGEDKLVKLGKRTYRLPPDIPVELWLKFNQYSEENLSDQEMIGKLYENILTLFQYGDPKITSVPLSMKQLVQVIGQVYGDEDVAEEPRPTRTNGASPRRSRPKRSRSSTS